MNKKIWLVPALALGLAWIPARAAAPTASPGAAAAPAAAGGGAALDAVTPYISQQTDLVVAVDLGAVNIEGVKAWMQKQMEGAGVDKATLDKMNAEAKPEMEKASKWLSDFKQAGGRHIYVTAALKDVMANGPLMVIPIEGQADGQALAKLFEANMGGAGEGGGDKPVAAVVGRTLLVGKQEAVNAGKTPQPAARPDLVQALGATATVKVALSGTNLKDPKNLPVPGLEIPPQAQGIEWISLNINAPPTVAASITVQAKDADTATQLSDMLTGVLAMMQQNADAQKALGDQLPALAKALRPQVKNRRITVGLDTNTIEKTIMPSAMKAAAEQFKARQGAPGAAGTAPPAPGL